MASFTNFLKLLKKNPATDGKDTFNIETMLNENWDKIDQKVEENSSAIGQKLVVSDSNIPIAERKEGSFYFIITDQQAGGSLENIKVSPTMGLKLI